MFVELQLWSKYYACFIFCRDVEFNSLIYFETYFYHCLKGKVMQIEKALINECLSVSELSWKFRIPTIYNFAVVYPRILLFS